MHFSVETASVDGALHMRGHAHAGWHLVAITAGAFEEAVGKRIFSLPVGALRLSRPGASHEIAVASSGMTCAILSLPAAWMMGVFGPGPDRGDSHFIAEPNIHDRICAAANLAMTSGGKAEASLIVREALAGIHGIVHAEEMGPVPLWVEDARRLIADGQSSRSIAVLARSARMSREHFSRAFRRYTGWRPVDYRATTRALRAVRLLKESEVPLAELAADLGYSDQSHMIRELKAYAGATPSVIRRLNRFGAESHGK
ncbi:helix-turn-helix transcriptional regulator [Brevundimonas sp. 2R-24]|uniref:Helix-turn-helix transcriptional regulator n=1 Tax=Peiella sedimenti TaxID=3061083 RepID=A0ABT8SPS2_9CAUL|nr:helix-turn-helix transcriptional regulator [Caulobacteraceae bacterium XZ-24]